MVLQCQRVGSSSVAHLTRRAFWFFRSLAIFISHDEEWPDLVSNNNWNRTRSVDVTFDILIENSLSSRNNVEIGFSISSWKDFNQISINNIIRISIHSNERWRRILLLATCGFSRRLESRVSAIGNILQDHSHWFVLVLLVANYTTVAVIWNYDAWVISFSSAFLSGDIASLLTGRTLIVVVATFLTGVVVSLLTGVAVAGSFLTVVSFCFLCPASFVAATFRRSDSCNC
mmetsp:Transcript_29873/g.44158  ORF Transcript_29873/g.44158 Transcript_29873/m.44158 type:complete len:230 (-) Transcript_29873:67-756(-)